MSKRDLSNCTLVPSDYTFVEVTTQEAEWDIIESTYDSTIYKTRQWFTYITKQGCEPMIVQVFKHEQLIGFFLGEKIKRCITLITSPFEGIGTGHQGLSMIVHITPQERLSIYKFFSKWIFTQKYSWYVQIEDWQLRMEDVDKNDLYFYEPHRVLYVDLTLTEDELFKNLHKDCKYSLRKAHNNGIIVRDADNVDLFIDVFYSQLADVFDNKKMTPTRKNDNVKRLIESIWPDKVMLLEAVTPEGDIVATGIVPIHGDYSATWQTASYKKYQNLRPNEILRWEAMLRCKRRGAKMINFCGTQAWKMKFGSTLTHSPRIYFCKYPILIKGKQYAKYIYYRSRSLMASLRGLLYKMHLS